MLKDIVTITVNDIVIPQGFSPNDDGDNDTFIIKGFDKINQDAELKIVNGAGTEIFSAYKSGDVDNWSDWDGKNSNGHELPEGTYYYLLKLTSLDNGVIDKRSGYIILKRY
ncbi:MAG: gliding motility-associated C-terminal domain-containing protein [Bacteroidales bacterium]|nr:gliding motility-associated C-terminal domain-containing protein [Bacteroidales bacterium]